MRKERRSEKIEDFLRRNGKTFSVLCQNRRSIVVDLLFTGGPRKWHGACTLPSPRERLVKCVCLAEYTRRRREGSLPFCVSHTIHLSLRTHFHMGKSGARCALPGEKMEGSSCRNVWDPHMGKEGRGNGGKNERIQKKEWGVLGTTQFLFLLLARTKVSLLEICLPTCGGSPYYPPPSDTIQGLQQIQYIWCRQGGEEGTTFVSPFLQKHEESFPCMYALWSERRRLLPFEELCLNKN